MFRYVPFYTHFGESFCHEWMLSFVKWFFCIYWNGHVVFVFSFVEVVYHIDWFAYVEPFLWTKFVENFCIYIHQRSSLKNPALLQLQHRYQWWLSFSPWPGNFLCSNVAIKKKKILMVLVNVGSFSMIRF